MVVERHNPGVDNLHQQQLDGYTYNTSEYSVYLSVCQNLCTKPNRVSLMQVIICYLVLWWRCESEYGVTVELASYVDQILWPFWLLLFLHE